MKSHLNNLFLAGFSHFKPLCKVNDEVLNALTAAAGGVIANPNVTGSGKIVIAVYPFTAIEQGKDFLIIWTTYFDYLLVLIKFVDSRFGVSDILAIFKY